MNGTKPTAPVVEPLSIADLLQLAWICDSASDRMLISDAERANWKKIARKLRYLIEQATRYENV